MKVYGDLELDGTALLRKNVTLENIGHHIAGLSHDGHVHLHPHGSFENGLSTKDAQQLQAFQYLPHEIIIPDDTGEWTGMSYEYDYPSVDHRMFKNVYYKTGAKPATQDITFQVWEGEDDSGVPFFEQTYPASLFVANTEITVKAKGYLEFDKDINYHIKISSAEDFSLKCTSDLLYPWTAGDISLVREDNLIQAEPWEAGKNYEVGNWVIENRRIFSCLTAGVQTGDFASNNRRWNCVSEHFDYYNSTTGWLSGGEISINAIDNTLIDITAGSMLRADYSNPSNPVTHVVHWDAYVGVDPELTSGTKWIAIVGSENNTHVVSFDSEFNAVARRETAVIGRVWNTQGTYPIIDGVANYKHPASGIQTAFQDFILEYGAWNISGNVYFPAVAGNLLLGKSSGMSYRYAADTTEGIENVHPDSGATAINSYFYALQGSSVMPQTTIDPNYWDNDGVRTEIPVGKWSIQEVWYYPVSELLTMLYGQTLFDTRTLAEKAVLTEVPTRNREDLSGAILRAYLVVQQGATDLTDTNTAIIHEVIGAGQMGTGSSASGASHWTSSNGVLSPTESGEGVGIGTNDLSTSLGDSLLKIKSPQPSFNAFAVESSLGKDLLWIRESSDGDGSIHMFDKNETQKVLFTTDTAVSYDNSGGNFGIGTDSPDAKLHVNGNAIVGGVPTPLGNPLHVYQSDSSVDATAGLVVEQAGSGDAVIHFLLTGNRFMTMGLDKSDGSKFKISKNAELGLGEDYFVIDDETGDVGIGTSNPVSEFEVRLGYNPENDFSQGSRISWNTGDRYMTQGVLDGYSRYGLYGRGLGGQPEHRVWTIDTWNGGGGIDDLDWHRWYCTGKIGMMLQNGMVKIGDDLSNMVAPTHTLEVDGDSMIHGYLKLDSTLIMSDSTPILWGDGSVSMMANSDIANEYWKIHTGGETRLIILGDGNVGFGTDEPNSKVAIQYNNASTDLSSIGNESIGLKNTNGTDGTWTGILNHGLYNHSSGIAFINDIFDENEGSIRLMVMGAWGWLENALVVSANGNVGIGVTIPTYKLDVDGDMNVNGDLIIDGLTIEGAVEINGDALTTETILNIHGNSADTSVRNLVFIHNDNILATNTTSLYVRQDVGGAMAIEIDGGIFKHRSTATTGIGWELDADYVTEGKALYVQGNALRTGSLASFYSNSSNTSGRNLVEIHNDNTLAVTTTCLHLQNDSTGDALATIGGITIYTGELNINAGGANITGGDLDLTNGDFNISNGDININNGRDLNISSGGDINMAQYSNIIMTGDIRITGTIDITNENLNMEGGNIMVNGGKLSFWGTFPTFVLPRLPQTAIDIYPAKTGGQIVYNTTYDIAQCWDGSSWRNMWS